MAWAQREPPAGGGRKLEDPSPGLTPVRVDVGSRDAVNGGADTAHLIDALRQRLGLTLSEARVAVLLAARCTNQEIADALGVTAHTGRRHTEKVLLKLGIHSRMHVRIIIDEIDPRADFRTHDHASPKLDCLLGAGLPARQPGEWP